MRPNRRSPSTPPATPSPSGPARTGRTRSSSLPRAPPEVVGRRRSISRRRAAARPNRRSRSTRRAMPSRSGRAQTAPTRSFRARRSPRGVTGRRSWTSPTPNATRSNRMSLSTRPATPLPSGRGSTDPTTSSRAPCYPGADRAGPNRSISPPWGRTPMNPGWRSTEREMRSRSGPASKARTRSPRRHTGGAAPPGGRPRICQKRAATRRSPSSRSTRLAAPSPSGLAPPEAWGRSRRRTWPPAAVGSKLSISAASAKTRPNRTSPSPGGGRSRSGRRAMPVPTRRSRHARNPPAAPGSRPRTSPSPG